MHREGNELLRRLTQGTWTRRSAKELVREHVLAEDGVAKGQAKEVAVQLSQDFVPSMLWRYAQPPAPVPEVGVQQILVISASRRRYRTCSR